MAFSDAARTRTTASSLPAAGSANSSHRGAFPSACSTAAFIPPPRCGALCHRLEEAVLQGGQAEARPLPVALVGFAVEDGVGEFLGGLGQGLLSRRDRLRRLLVPCLRVRLRWGFLLLHGQALDVVVPGPGGRSAKHPPEPPSHFKLLFRP